MAKKIVVYTAIIGGYDVLEDPEVVNKNFDYLCFTDTHVKSKVFKNIKVKLYKKDKIRTARRIKILAHKYVENYDCSIWIDGNIFIIGNLNKLINKYLTNDIHMAVMEHRTTGCIYKEAKTCIRLRKEVEKIKSQINHYNNKNYPRKNGLLESGLLIRNHHNPIVKATMRDWWHHVDIFSNRDQISFNFVAWNNNLKFNYMMRFNSPEAHKYFVLRRKHRKYK